MFSRLFRMFAIPSLLAFSCHAQETRGGITGKITDQQGASIPGANVVVTNLDTNLIARTMTNQTGYFEVNLLNPGSYSVSVEAPGFKKSVRAGLVLNVAGRLDIPFQLQVGQIAETIEVTAEAPMLDTTTASGGRVIDNRQIMQLPFSDLNPFVLAGLAAGMQWTGRPDYRRPFDNNGTSAFNTMGGVGNNEYTIDGASNVHGRVVAYVPPADAVEEFKLETTPFDASYGHSSGATVNVMTKAGSNAFHGSLYNQHWQKRWNATQHFQRLQFENDVATGKKRPGDEKNLAGRQNYYGAGIGGPVWIPKVFDGRNKVFFYFMYSGIMKDENEPGADTNRTVPKLAWRQGDFSDMLAIDAVKYTVYDPRSARRQGNTVVRTPFPGNRGIPVLNPMYQFYEPLYPKPNDVPGLVSPEGFNNYFASGMPKNERFKSAVNRIDYAISERHRLFGRWYWNRRNGDEYDWTYETRRGLQSNGITRINKGIGADYTWMLTNSTVVNIASNWGRYADGSSGPLVEVAKSYKPSDVGLPAYLDQKAGDFHRLPGLDFNNISDLNNGYPFISNRETTGQAKIGVNMIKGAHSMKFGLDERRYWRTQGSPGNTSGNFTFRNNWVRAADNDNRSSSHALDWAAFMLGMPTGIAIATNDSAYWSTPFRALYFQDDWRVTSRLRLNLGLRYEREGGTRERFNRGIAGGFDFDDKFVFSDLVEAAYRANPIAGLSSISVRGTAAYLGAGDSDTFTRGTHHFLPKVGAVYQINNRTVLRAGYGWFYDIFSSFTNTPRQDGYSQGTGTVLTTDNGLTFCCGAGAAANLGAGRTILNDPFPVRANGTRFDSPYGNSLGPAILAGRGVTLPARDFNPAWQQRWRIGIQREIASNMVIDVSYNGSFARIPVDQRIDYLPQQYWATGMTRRQDIDDALNANVPNPFNIRNLAALQQSQPLIYSYLSTQGFFTGSTIRRHQLLRQFPNLNGSNGLRPGVDFNEVRGRNRYHDMQLQFERRFGRGFQSSVMYTYASGEEADFYNNEFDSSPLVYRPQDALRPHRLAWSSIWELPFGKGRRWVTDGPAQHILGGWQLSWIYQFQSGSATGWGNRFFYGDLETIGDLFSHDEVHRRDIHRWFDPAIVYTGSGAVPQGFGGFEGRSNMQPGSYHVRVFPTRLDALRTDGLRTWDLKILRRFRIHERAAFNFSVDLLNATNHTNFGGPNTDPTNRNFGSVTSTNGYARVIQLTGRIEF